MEMDVGAKIRTLRKARDWTQQTMAEKANLPGPWTVSRLETRGTDSLSTLEVVCKALDIEVWELLHPTHLFQDENDDRLGEDGEDKTGIEASMNDGTAKSLFF